MSLRALPATGVIFGLFQIAVVGWPAHAAQRTQDVPYVATAANKAEPKARAKRPAIVTRRPVALTKPPAEAARAAPVGTASPSVAKATTGVPRPTRPATKAATQMPVGPANAKAVTAGVAAAAVVVPAVAPESVGLSTQRLQRIGEVFQHEIQAGHLPGAVVMVARRGTVVYQQAWGQIDPAAKLPMRPDAIFRIYDLGQPVVAVAALMLVEDGLLQLNDPVAKHLPAMAGAKPASTAGRTAAAAAMTVHDLLRQTSGLGYGSQPGPSGGDGLLAALKTRPESAAEMVSRIARTPLTQAPGTTWQVGPSADLLGRVVEAAAGKPLRAFLKERLFDPLGMRDATFVVGEAAQTRIAQPAAGITLVDMAVAPGHDAAGSGLAMTSADYLRFAQMLLNGGILDGKRVLSPSTVRLMTADHLGSAMRFADKDPGGYLMGTPGYSFGLGVAVRTADGIASVPGSAGEFAWGSVAGSFFWVDPKEQMVVVYQTQAPTPDREHYRRLIKQLVYQAIVN